MYKNLYSHLGTLPQAAGHSVNVPSRDNNRRIKRQADVAADEQQPVQQQEDPQQQDEVEQQAEEQMQEMQEQQVEPQNQEEGVQQQQVQEGVEGVQEQQPEQQQQVGDYQEQQQQPEEQQKEQPQEGGDYQQEQQQDEGVIQPERVTRVGQQGLNAGQVPARRAFNRRAVPIRGAKDIIIQKGSLRGNRIAAAKAKAKTKAKAKGGASEVVNVKGNRDFFDANRDDFYEAPQAPKKAKGPSRMSVAAKRPVQKPLAKKARATNRMNRVLSLPDEEAKKKAQGDDKTIDPFGSGGGEPEPEDCEDRVCPQCGNEFCRFVARFKREKCQSDEEIRTLCPKTCGACPENTLPVCGDGTKCKPDAEHCQLAEPKCTKVKPMTLQAVGKRCRETEVLSECLSYHCSARQASVQPSE